MQEVTLVDKILGSDIPYITLAVPFFFVLIGVELAVGRALRRRLYDYSDTLSDLSCGIVSQMGGIFIAAATLSVYTFVWERFGVLDVSSLTPAGKWAAAAALFVGVDFFYYWFHRMSHEVNFLWAAHMVHHQSEEYNLAVALRQSTFQGYFSWTFYLPLALVGFPPSWFVAMVSFNTLYQFWIHTCAIKSCGRALEAVINTPSHHRVHHGKNPQYIDRNHAGTLIIWDKLFGTFEPEGEAVVFGTTRELRSWNPVWANLFEWVALYEEGKAFPRWQDRLRLFFAEPGWRPAGLPPEPAHAPMTVDSQIKYRTPLRAGMVAYTITWFTLTLGAGVVVLLFNQPMGVLAVTPIALWVIFSLLGIGGLIEGHAWARRFEGARLVTGVALVGAYTASQPTVMGGAVGAAIVVSAASLVALSRLSAPALAPAPGRA